MDDGKETIHWSRMVNWGVIVTFVIQAVVVVDQFSTMKTEIRNLKGQVTQLNDTRSEKVDKEVLEQMFITRDVQIIDLKETVKENQRILREISSRLPQ